MSAELRDHLNNLKDNHISVLRSHVKRFENLKTSNQEQHESNVKNIQAQTDTIIQEIKNIQIMLIQESEKTTNENKSRLSELQDIVTIKVEELESKYSDFNKDLTSGCDIDKIMARNEVIALLEKYQSDVRQAKIHHSKFVPGEIDVTSIKKSFGLIEVIEGDTSDNKPVKDKSANTLSNADLKDVSNLPEISLAKHDQESVQTTFSNKVPVTNAPVTPRSTSQKPVNRESENDSFTTDKVTSSYERNTEESRTEQNATGYKSNNTNSDRTSKISSDTATSTSTSPDITLNIISQFKHKPANVRSICPVSDTTAYLRCDGEYNIDKVDKKGQIQGCIKLDFRVTKEGQIKQQLYTGPLRPNCLCLSSDDHILVTMHDELSYDVNKTSKRLVTRMTTTGQILTTYEYENDKRLFIILLGIDENTNKDICVVNRTSNKSNVVILNASGGLKCTYKGQESEMFVPVKVKCDKFGQIIVSDLNKKIHILNRNGQLIKYLMTEKDLQNKPVSLAIDRNNLLWVGCVGGLVYIVKYLEDPKTTTN
ncbi:hypothetical protein KUTeg_023705 [Tegillarca granosa]|uniref:Tripartite motif-containing protein 2 n=1 Tax=Tegillarca granosa TaxID=220873 RepID=A0ABQ9E3D3_TEGGR|nr:hypothetical protein KUTeg_023705 [Tegillarca granosa]